MFRYAVATGLLGSDPSRDLRGALPPWRPEHYPTLTDPRKVGVLLRADAGKGKSRLAAALAQQVDESGKLGSVGLDPFGVGAIVDALAEVGIAGNDRVVGITQGWKLTGAIKTAERKLADGTFSHGGLGLMAWAVSNAKVEPKGNAIVITKQASGTAKIDPLMAAFNAVALMAMNPQAAGRSYLRSSEMLVL